VQISIKAIKESTGSRIQVEETLNELPGLSLGGDVLIKSPFALKASITNTGSCYLLQGKIEVLLELNCHRCLQTFTRWHTVPLFEEYFPEEKNKQREKRQHQQHPDAREAPDERDEWLAEHSTIVGDVIDLTPTCRDHVMLGLPIKVLCREDCPGLCPVCGAVQAEGSCRCRAEKNVDPRLAVLKELLASTPDAPEPKPDREN
jgi:uncharacterized protein